LVTENTNKKTFYFIMNYIRKIEKMYTARQYKGKKTEKQVIVRRCEMGEETVMNNNVVS